MLHVLKAAYSTHNTSTYNNNERFTIHSWNSKKTQNKLNKNIKVNYTVKQTKNEWKNIIQKLIVTTKINK